MGGNKWGYRYFIQHSKNTHQLHLLLRSWIWCCQFDVGSSFPLAQCAQVTCHFIPHPSSPIPTYWFSWSFPLTCSVLASLSGHWSTGAQLNHEEVNLTYQIAMNQVKWLSFHFNMFCQIAKLVASRNHMAGYDLSHELFKSAYDIEFYSGLCIWSNVDVAFLCPFRGSWKWELPNTSCKTVASVFGMFITLFSPIISSNKVQDREKEDAFPLYFEDMMTGHWAGSYYRLIHNNSISNF